MKVGILITCYNRPEYLKETLWCLERCDLSLVNEILFIDDNSTDLTTKQLIDNFKCSVFYLVKKNHWNKGIKESLLLGYHFLFNRGNDIVINFDSDALIRPDAITKLVEAYSNTPNEILTGFHSTTKNANGTERHFIIEDNEDLLFKKSVGGINMCVDYFAYTNFIKPALNEPGNWDHNACIKAGGAYCLKESVVQHIGFDSSLNHTEQPDIADSFYYWHLPNVTLLCADNNPERIKPALKKCTEFIKFGDIQLLHADIKSKEAYSDFMITEAHKYVNTSHCLVFQHDGYVNNWKAWDNTWLQYDYIGAPWHYNDGHNVGNGGFSLRSKKLMELCAEIVKERHPEDHHICRTYRRQLEAKGMKFAPIGVAEKFAFEGYLQPTKVLKDQFGVHGKHPRTNPVQPKVKERYCFNQFLSLGDILFLIPMARALMQEGNTVLWPIDAKYLNIKKHFPDINFVDKATVNIDYERRQTYNSSYGVVLPYRWASEILRKTLKDCMRAKYDLYRHDYRMWRQLTWQRDYEAEERLIQLLNMPEKFNLVNRYFGHQAQYQIRPEIDNHLPCVEMRPIDGFTLIDWMGVMEKASEIHTANTSILYILELLNLNIPIHLYRRGIWNEVEFEYTSYLHTKPYILH